MAISSTEHRFSIRSLDFVSDKTKALDHLSQKLRNQTWKFEVKAINTDSKGNILSAVLYHSDFAEWVVLVELEIASELSKGDEIPGGAKIGKKKKGGYRFEFVPINTSRKRAEPKWDEKQLPSDTKRRDIEKELENKWFDGYIEKKGPDYGWIRSPFFSQALFLPCENVANGTMKEKAKVDFQVQIAWNQKKNCYSFQPICASSHVQAQDITGVIASAPQWIREGGKLTKGGKPVLIIPQSDRHDARAKKNEVQKKCPKGYRIFRFDEINTSYLPTIYSQNLANCLAALPADLDQDLVHKRFKNAIAQHLFPIIASQEKDQWTVVMDESGPCQDHQTEQLNPSAMMAVIIPPGTQPPPCPVGYHSIESGSECSIQLRDVILKNPDIYCIGWSYRSGRPYQLSQSRPELHQQMWRNALVFCLELIALANQSQSSTQRTAVHVYVENVGQFTPGSHFLDAFTFDLAEHLQNRKGWRNLEIYPPCIVAKDEHPYMGYVDTLGHIFRMDKSRISEEAYQQASSILDRKRTVILPYEADALQNLANIIRQSGNSPLQAVISLANSREEYISPYSRAILRKMAGTLLSDLYPMDIERLCSIAQENLSKTPTLYYANSLLSDCLDETVIETLHAEFKTAAYLNRLASANYKGDTKRAERYLGKLHILMPKAMIPDLNYRFHAQLIDYYQNCLDFDRALSVGHEVLDKAKKDCQVIESAAHVLGAYFLTLALSGETSEAESWWEMIFNLQRNTDDRLRYYTYRIHLFIDMKKWDLAWSVVDTIRKEQAALSVLCLHNYYLLAAILKLEAHSAGLEEDEKNLLFSIQPPHFHPGQLIAFWNFQATKKATGKPNFDRLKERIEACNAVRCNALRLIHACLHKQLVQDEDCQENDIQVESLDTLQQTSPEIHGWLSVTNELERDSHFRFLEPLWFNFW